MGRLTKIIHELAKLIKSLGTIVGFVVAAYAIGVNYLPTFSATQFLTRWLDPIIAGQNPERFSEGYLYYEIGLDGGLTSFGQLVQVPNPTSNLPRQEMKPTFSALSVGDYVMSKSEVYLRPTPSREQDFIRSLGSNECFEIVSLARELTAEERGNASSGGWLEVVGRPCS